MSLLNDALSDLDLREGPSRGKQTVTLNEDRYKKHSLLNKSFVSAFILVFLTGVFVEQYVGKSVSGKNVLDVNSLNTMASHNNTVGVKAPSLDDVTVTNSNAFFKENKVSESDSKKTNATSETIVEDNTDEQLQNLLLLVDQAINDNRLTVPKNNNAMYFLSEAISVSPNDESISKKIEQVKAMFLAQLEYTLANNRLSIAKKLINRLSVFNVTEDQKNTYLIRLTNIEKTLSSNINVNQEKIVENREVEKNEAWVTSVDTIDVKEENLLAEVRTLLDVGDNLTAEERLNHFISSYPDSLRVNAFAFDYYLDNDRVDDAGKLISSLSKINIYKPYFEARMAHHNQDTRLAVAILERNPADKKIVFLHGALLAALYQKQNKHERARRVYIDLLQLDPVNTQFLLGYAISSDALKDDSKSMMAYNKVLTIGHSSRQVMDFVEQRIAAIKNNTIEEVNLW